MTEFQEYMLIMCFSTSVGLFAGCLSCIIQADVSYIKEKLRKRKEKKESDAKKE